MRAKRIALNSAVYIELSSGCRQVKGLLIHLVDTAAAAPSSVLQPSVIFFSDKGYSEISCKQNCLYISGFVVSFLKLVKSRRTAGTESFQGTMSNEGASSTRFRLSLDFSKWGRMQMPRGGTFDSESSNTNSVFGFKNATIGWVFRQGFEFKNIV